MATVEAIYRYPVKGLSAEPLTRATLAAGETVPGDRLYAIENGPSDFHPVTRPYLHKTHFLMLMKNERLAALRTAFDHGRHTLTIVRDGREVASGDLRTEKGRTAIEHFFAEFCASELRGPPRILHAPRHSFSDMPRKVVSIINLDSLAALERLIGAPVHPLRFRANLYVAGWPAWSELDLLDRELSIGTTTVRLRVVKRIVRCAATNVNPDSAVRDFNLPQTIMRTYGHGDCGVYTEVVEGGEIAPGDAIAIL